VSVQFRALIPLLLGKEALIPFKQEAGWISSSLDIFETRNVSCLYQDSNPASSNL